MWRGAGSTMTTNEHADAHFQWWWRWKTTTTLEDEHKCSFSRVGKGGDAGIVSAGADAAGGCRHPSCCCHCLCWQPQLQLLLLLLLVLPCVHVETSLSCHVTVSKRKKKEILDLSQLRAIRRVDLPCATPPPKERESRVAHLLAAAGRFAPFLCQEVI